MFSNNGRQKKYTLSVSKLIEMNINKPDYQRDKLEEHVEEIYKFQLEHYKKYGTYLYFGCITIGICNQEKYLLDGQHRLFSMEKIYNINEFNDFNVDIEIIECQSMEEMQELFTIINKNIPVRDYLKNFKKEVAVLLREYLKLNYSNYISTSQTPRSPNINLEIFLDEFQKKYEKRLNKFKNDQEFIEWFDRENMEHGVYLRTKNDEKIQNAILKIDSMEGRLRSSKKFYLGTYFLKNITSNVSNSLKKKLWNQWKTSLNNTEELVLCPCCESEYIAGYDFHAGHKISFKNGGSTSLDNLIPLCSSCNLSMGTMNYEEYKENFK